VPCLFTLPLYAEADGPDYWRVFNVNKGNVLNIRSSADIKAIRIGKIPYDSQCVKNHGCKGGLTFDEFTTLSESEKQQILKQQPRWCRVSYQGVSGWVAGRYLRESHCNDDESHSGAFIDPLNHSYSIEGEIVNLTDGSARVRIAGTTAFVTTEAVANTVFTDLTADDKKDAVQILIQQTGGSGTFYYLSVAASDDRVIDSYFLGDRIKIEAVNVVDKNMVVTYLDRGKAQAMSDQPVVSMTKRFKLDGDKIVLLQ